MFGRKVVFGNKRPPIEEPKRTAFSPADRVFDKEIFDGEVGDFLRSAGFAPDDPKNCLDLQDPVSALLAKDDAALNRSLKALNDIAPYPLGAFTLLREELWQGRFGKFLMQRLDLSPYRPWNILFLPMDAAGTAALGLPVGTYDDDGLEESEIMIEMLAELFAGKTSPEANSIGMVCDSVADNFPYLFPPEILDYSPTVRDARRRVRSYAVQRAAIGRFPMEVIIKCQQTFLGKPEEQLVA